MKLSLLLFFFLLTSLMYGQDDQIYPCNATSNIRIQIGDYKSGDSITIDRLLRAGRVKAEAGKFTILSYRITMNGTGFSCEDDYGNSNSGDKFTEKTILFFRRSRRGTFIKINSITAKDTCGNLILLKPAVYVVK